MAEPLRLLERRAARAALLAAVLVVGAAVRLATWPWVYGGDEVRIVGDGDVLYHLLQAGRLVADGLGAVWRDPGLNHPLGADVPWPPLFDGLLAGAGWLQAGLAAPDHATLESAAMWVPALLGVLMVLLTAWLGRALLGGRPWLDAALVLALLPSHAMLACLGRADQHALEPILLGLVVLAAARLARGGGGGAAVALLALSTALSFWNWNGSALYLALVAGFAAAWHALARADDPAPGPASARLAVGFAAGAVLLAGSVALLAPTANLFTAGLSGLTGLQPMLVAGTALCSATLAAGRRLRPRAGAPERAATSLLALLLPPALLLLLPWTRQGIERGLTMLAARGWYRTIEEFRPLLPSGVAPLADDLSALLANHGLTPLLVAASLPLAWRRWRRGAPAERGPTLLFAVLCAGTLVLGWSRNRFGVYLSVAEALATALLARELAAWVSARWPTRRLAGPVAGVALAALAVAPVLPGLPEATWAARTAARYTELAPLARLAGQVPTRPGREGVLVPWSHGHDVRYWSGRPVVASPFGIEGGEGALQADAAFHRSTSQAEAEALLAERQVGLVVTYEPLDEIVSLAPFAPPDALPVFQAGPDPDRLSDVKLMPAFRMLVVVRLWLWDGQWGLGDGRLLRDGPASLDAFRLLGESQSISVWNSVGVPMFKLFQPVAGARVTVRGAAPGARVDATTTLKTNTGRVLEWSTHVFAKADGVVTLRLPYAAGLNGAVEASPWRIGDGRAASVLAPSEQAVQDGAALEVRLGR